jgi:hypothetical protein
MKGGLPSRMCIILRILFDAWMTFAYVNPKLLMMRLMTRWGTEIKYPMHSPPLNYLLPKKSSYGRFTTTHFCQKTRLIVFH